MRPIIDRVQNIRVPVEDWTASLLEAVCKIQLLQ